MNRTKGLRSETVIAGLQPRYVMSFMLGLLLVLGLASVAGAQGEPAVMVADQEIADGTVTVPQVVSDGPGWMVIHADADGKPGPVIGYAAVEDGTNTDVVVEIDEAAATPVLHAMLHTDAGTVGTYEFPGPDGPVTAGDAIVMSPFSVEAMMAEEEMAEAMDIVDIAVSDENFSTLVAAVQAAGLADALKGEGPFTVFAPTNAAFEALPDGLVESLLADPAGDLTQILLYHVVSGKVMAADVTDGLEATTLQGSPVKFSVSDGSVMINDANIVATDIEASNGVIHVIDAVITPPVETAMPEEEMAEEEMGEAMDIVDIAASDENFSTLVAAVQAAGLADALKGEGPFTVFAPTNAAFEALPDGLIESLLADPAGDLTQILLYHVVSGKVMAADVTDGLEATTLQGSPVKFSVSDGSVMINDANVVATDIEASNGVIHVIDAVITPPSETTMPEEEMAEEETMDEGAKGAPAALPQTGTGPLTAGSGIVVGALALLVLGGGALIARRRDA